MINSSTTASSSIIQEEASSVTATKTNKKRKATKKNKKKISKGETEKKPLEISCYQNLRSRNIAKNNDTNDPVAAFIDRTRVFENSLQNEKITKYSYSNNFPGKSFKYTISLELNSAYEKLAQLYANIEKNIHQNKIATNQDVAEELIVDLISIKQEILTIWNKYNPTIAYKYGNLQDDGTPRLEDKMLDFIQGQLINCYNIINDEKNKQLIINQLIEQKSTNCVDLLTVTFLLNINNYNNLDKLNFNDILLKVSELEAATNKARVGKKSTTINRHNSSNQLAIVAMITKLFLDKTNIDYSKLSYNDEVFQCFSHVVRGLICQYYNDKNYIQDIKKLSSGIDFYLSQLENPFFNKIHTMLLTENGIIFLKEFSCLIKELNSVVYSSKNIIDTLQTLATYKQVFDEETKTIQQKIIQLFTKYNIPTDNIISWYDIFIGEKFTEIFYKSANMVVNVAKLIDFSKNIEEKFQITEKDKHNINFWLDTLANDYKSLIEDKLAWNEIPKNILFFLCGMTGEAIRFTFGDERMAKQEDIAKLYAKTSQVFKPFLGTTLLAIANKDSYDDLLANMDMLEFISQQTDKTKYIQSSKYLLAQLSSYLIAKNDKLDLTKKKLLFTKAEKLYLEIASLGINRAYLLLAETLTTLAKEKTYTEDFSEAAQLYDQASSYCQKLSEAANLEEDLQDLALINMNCFKAEADVLRKIQEEQTALLKDLATPPPATKTKKKSDKQKASITTETNKQQLAEEITTTELVDWHKTYKPVATKPKPKNITTTQTSKTKKIKSAAELPSITDINNRCSFWRNIRELQSSTNLEVSHTLRVKLINNNYFKALEDKFKDGITEQDSWVVLFVYQSIAYHHFLQLKHVQEVSNNTNNLKLFNVGESKFNEDIKTKKITFANLYAEADYAIRQAIKLVCPDIPNIETNNLQEIILALSPNNYDTLPLLHKNQLAAIVSTYGHLTSIDDAAHGRKGKFRLAAKLYAKANEINPNRLIRKQQATKAY